MNKEQELELEEYYQELKNNKTITTLNEALVFKLAYEKALIMHAVSKRTFRKAIATDIVEGAVVYLLGDDNDIHTITIDEVLRPDDQWKGFCGDDGCRYGLEGLYVC